ncbi:class I tRNA ligase family protein [Glycomyces harbinensis]|uniref:Methionyl-tRNA synthetase n=1 Tax=Glycomyces harbinensis TaxID=58114 RepID=A0A1G6ZJC9_9ACTN|nr:class I tRNA ligase family protein [Glycomyces harbinensis]SDE02759.1 methionyl-tRNA synthetase [Glycomyces harbinensis]
MILNHYSESDLSEAFGIDMSSVDGLGVGAGWGRVAPGASSTSHQHDETEFFVIVSGEGELRIDGAVHPARPGTVVLFEPFESHVITNTGEADLVFFTQYWRDAARARHAVASRTRTRAAGRPQFVFSTPPTPNGDLHLGHLSGPYLGADAYVRFQRLNGNRAWHLTGSDDYQSYVEAAAERDGVTPAEAARHYSAEIAATLKAMDIDVDEYYTTSTDDGYEEGLRRFFTRLVRSGSVRPKATPALVEGEGGEYLYEVDVSGTCPGCSGPTGGNICEECGEPNLVADLGEPRSRRGDAAPRAAEVERWTLPLHEFAETVAGHHLLGRVPARLRELAHRVFARDGLELPVSHPSDWGVRPAEDDLASQVIWVWPEMSYGFLHGIERLGAGLGEQWSRERPSPDWKVVHFFGYDNSFYHSILYPVLYRLAFPQWNPDIDYHVNEFYLLEGAKFSTSRRHAIWGKEILSPETVDAVRYYLCRTRPEDERTDFRRAEYDRAVTDVLIGQWQAWLDDLGERVRSDHGGLVPDAGTWTTEHADFLARLTHRLEQATAALGAEGFSLRRAAAVLDALVEDATAFSRLQSRLRGLDRWSSEARTATALELAAARLLATAAAPLMPRFSQRLAASLGLAVDAWPDAVELVPPGNRTTLDSTRFFAAPATPASLPWLRSKVAVLLGLEADFADLSLPALGANSLAATTLQYHALTELKADVPLETLLADAPLSALAAALDGMADADLLAALGGETR